MYQNRYQIWIMTKTTTHSYSQSFLVVIILIFYTNMSSGTVLLNNDFSTNATVQQLGWTVVSGSFLTTGGYVRGGSSDGEMKYPISNWTHLRINVTKPYFPRFWIYWNDAKTIGFLHGIYASDVSSVGFCGYWQSGTFSQGVIDFQVINTTYIMVRRYANDGITLIDNQTKCYTQPQSNWLYVVYADWWGSNSNIYDANSGGAFDDILVEDSVSEVSTGYNITTNKTTYNYTEKINILYSVPSSNSYPVDSFYIMVLRNSEGYWDSGILPNSEYTSPFTLPINLPNGNYSARMYKWTNNSLLASTNFSVTNYTPPTVPTPYPTPNVTYTPNATYTPIPDVNATAYNGSSGLGNITGNMSGIGNQSLIYINNGTTQISSQISSYNYSKSKSVYTYFLIPIINMIPAKLWGLIILGWALEISLILLKR